MRAGKVLLIVAPFLAIGFFVVLAYGNIVFFGSTLNPVLMIPQQSPDQLQSPFIDDEIKNATGYADIRGARREYRGWPVDLANPAYLEWPVNLFVGKSLKAGHIPLVLPHQGLGVPLVGQYCHRVLSPYQMVENLFLPGGYDFFLLLRLVLAGFFTWLFLRPLCRESASAWLGAVGYGLGGIMVIYSNHEEVANVAMTLPLLLWAVRAFFDRPGIHRAAWLALALAAVHTAGQPEIQIYVLLLALAYGLSRLAGMASGRRKGSLGLSLLAIAGSALIAAPQIYLFLEFHREAWTFHPPGGNLGLQSPVLVKDFIFSFLPRVAQTPEPWAYRTINLTWDWVGGYFGFGLLLLAAASARNLTRRREALVFGLYFLFLLAKNLGWSPAQLLGLLPLFDQTWSPRWASPTWSFSLAVLAALGLDRLLVPAPERETGSPPETPTGLKNVLFHRPLSVAAPLLVGFLALAALCRLRGAAAWAAADLRGYVLNSGLFFLFLAGALGLGWGIIPRCRRLAVERFFRGFREGLLREQEGMIGILSAAVFIVLVSSPTRHYLFSGPEPLAVYLLGAPLLLLALWGLFFMAAYPRSLAGVVLAALAIPAALAAGWVVKPGGDFLVFPGLFLLALFFLVFFPPARRRLLLPLSSLALLGWMTFLILKAQFPFSPERNAAVLPQLGLSVFTLGFFSWLCRRRPRGREVGGWLFLIPVWAELAGYIPQNHFGLFLLLSAVPFLGAAVTVAAGDVWGSFCCRRKLLIPVLALIVASAGILLVEKYSPNYLPRRLAPEKPLPFMEFLRQRRDFPLTGIGRVLSPNFASAHGLADLRGCVSLNTADWQFFLERVLAVVPPDGSFSLWYTGDNQIDPKKGNPYRSSADEQRLAWREALPFFRLASARYVLSPARFLDRIGYSGETPMEKVYSGEVDIWEIPALPPAFIARQALAISMREETEAWKEAVVEDPRVLQGELVILEKGKGDISAGDASLARAELVSGEDPNLLKVKFFTSAPGYLVVNRVYTNLLRARLAGRSLPVLKANGPFLAVPVPGSPREQELELSYFSPGVRMSFLLSGLGLLACGFALIRFRAARPNGGKAPPSPGSAG